MSEIDRFNPLDYPSALMKPDLLSARSAWVEHIPFAFAAVQMCLPRTIVELGASRGDSYCAFCQAVASMSLTTRCTAIDTWKGDAHAGKHTDLVLSTLRAHHDPRYSTFSTLMQSTFDDVRDQFADGTIDLLHIDGLHTYEAVKHDFESWLPKLSTRGVVLFHDTEARHKDFGVWKLWAEISVQYPSFNFRHGSGLGVLAAGKEAPPPMLRFIKLANRQRADVLRYFEALGGGINALRFRRALVDGYVTLHEMLNQHHQVLGEKFESTDARVAHQSPVEFMRNVIEQVFQLIKEDRRSPEEIKSK